MTTFLLGLLAGMVLCAIYLSTRRAFRNATAVIDREAARLQKARAVTPDTFERQ